MQNTEAQIDNIYQQSDLLNNALTKVKYLTPDEQRVKEISQGYANEVDNITKAITQNPMEWRKYMPTIKDLGRKMNNDFTTGELGKIQGNYNAYQEYDKYIAEKEKEGKINPQTGQVFRQHTMRGFEGTSYDPQTGVAKSLNAEKPLDDLDLNKWMDEQLKNLKASGKVEWDAKAGQYIIETERGWEGITQDKILGVLTNSISADPNLVSYLSQRQKYGIINDVFDEKGILNLYTTNDKNEKVMKNNVLTNALSSAMQEHSWMKNTGGIKNMTANPIYTQQVANAHDRSMAEVNHNYRIQEKGIDNQLAKDLAMFKDGLERDTYLFKESNKATESTTTDADGNTIKVSQPKVNMINGNISVNPFAGKTTEINKKNVTLGLNSAKQDLASLKTARDKAVPGSQQYKYFDELIYRKEQEVFDYNELYTKSCNTAKGKLGDKDYNMYVSMRDGGMEETKQKIRELQNKMQISKNAMNDPSSYNKESQNYSYENGKIIVTKGMTPANDYMSYQNQLMMEQAKLKTYEKLSAKFNGYMDGYLKDNSHKTNYTKDIIQTTAPQNQLMLGSIEGNRNEFDIIDPTTGERTNTTKFNTGWFKGGNALTFEGAADESNIWKYLKDNGKKLEDIIEIKGITGPGGFGSGSQMVYTFKDLPGVNPEKVYVSPMPRSVETQVAGSLPEKDANINTIKTNILDSRRHYVINSLTGFKDMGLEAGQQGPSKEIVIDNPYSANYEMVKIIVTPIGNNSSEPLLKAEAIDANGNRIPLGGKERDGLFLNPQDFSESLYPTNK